MSARTRDLPRRSCLSVPGSSEKMLGKGPALPADMMFLDLEDSVAPLEKEAARAKVVDAIKNQDWGDKVLCVRINAWDTEWTAFDVIEVVGNAGEPPRRDHAARRCSRPPRSSRSTCCSPRSRPRRACPSATSASRRRSRRPAASSTSRRSAPPRRGSRRSSSARSTSPRRWRCRSLTGGLQIPEYPGDYFHYVFSKILMAGPRQRAAGDRRPVRASARPRGLPRLLPAHPDPRLRRQVGAAPRPGRRSSTRCSRRRRSSSTRRGTSSTPTRRRPPRATARAR